MTVIDQSNSTKGDRVWTRYDATGTMITFGPSSVSDINETSNVHYVIKPDRRPKPTGWLFPTPYTFRDERILFPRGKGEAVNAGYIDRYFGCLSGLAGGFNLMPGGNSGAVQIDLNPGHLSQAEAKALNALLKGSRQRDGTWSAGQAWGERRQTAQLLVDTAQRLVDGYRSLRSGRPKQAFRDLFPNGTPKDWKQFKGTPYYQWYRRNFDAITKRGLRAAPQAVAGAFLELQNGWKPLLNDIHRATEALAFRNTQDDWVITGKGYVKYSRTNTERAKGAGSVKSMDGILDWTMDNAHFVRIDATVSDLHLRLLAQLGLDNPALLAWELTPLSYIADYFVAVGEWLQSLSAADGLSFYSGSWTQYGQYTALLREAETSPHNKFRGTCRYVHWQRKVYTNFPVPIPPLDFKPQSLNVLQKGNILAVLTRLFGGHTVPQSRGG